MSDRPDSPDRPARPPAPPALAEGVAAGDRRALARAITLVESTRPDHRAQAAAMLAALPARQALRIGLTGTPEQVKAAADEVTGHVDDDGLLAVLLTLL